MVSQEVIIEKKNIERTLGAPLAPSPLCHPYREEITGAGFVGLYSDTQVDEHHKAWQNYTAGLHTNISTLENKSNALRAKLAGLRSKRRQLVYDLSDLCQSLYAGAGGRKGAIPDLYTAIAKRIQNALERDEEIYNGSE